MEAGRIIGGKYRLLGQIGEGGAAFVWSAVHDTLGRTVAIKFLRSNAASAQAEAARFELEARNAARAKHRFVVDVFDFGVTDDGLYYMVQELLDGQELTGCIDYGPAWQVRDVVLFIGQCLSGLEAVHRAGVVHRDLKPENIFVMRDGQERFPKLLDFGISRVAQSPSTGASNRPPALARPGPRTPTARLKELTVDGAAHGTPWYMSPEQLRGREDLDGRADLYSMGVILYEWLAGGVPYDHENLSELSLQIAAGSATPLFALRPELGQPLSKLIERALAAEPASRFGSAAELRAQLTALVPSLPDALSVVQDPELTEARPDELAAVGVAPASAAPQSASAMPALPKALQLPPMVRTLPPTTITVKGAPPPLIRTLPPADVAAPAVAVVVQSAPPPLTAAARPKLSLATQELLEAATNPFEYEEPKASATLTEVTPWWTRPWLLGTGAGALLLAVALVFLFQPDAAPSAAVDQGVTLQASPAAPPSQLSASGPSASSTTGNTSAPGPSAQPAEQAPPTQPAEPAEPPPVVPVAAAAPVERAAPDAKEAGELSAAPAHAHKDRQARAASEGPKRRRVSGGPAEHRSGTPAAAPRTEQKMVRSLDF